MDFKIVVLSDKFKAGQIDFQVPKILSCFAKTGNKISNITLQGLDKTLCQDEIANANESLIFFIENDYIDDIIVENIKNLGVKKEMTSQLAVMFEKDGKNLIFIPIDVDYIALLEKILEKFDDGLKHCKFHIFGENPTAIEEKLKNLELDGVNYVIQGSNLLTDVYISYEGSDNLIDDKQVKIASLFKDQSYSENDLGLSQIVYQLLRLKNYKLAVKENVTGGKILAKLSEENVDFGEVLRAGAVTSDIGDFDAEKIYSDSFNFLKQTTSDVVLEISGKCDERGMSCLIAVGDRQSIHVYKNRFNAPRKDCLEMATNCALFHLIKKLRQNDFAF